MAALWVFNEKNEVLIARRSKIKKHHPNLWGPSVAGSVEEGETYQSNILKEANEEIGLRLDTVTAGPKIRVSSIHEYFTQWFFAKVSSQAQFTLQEGEVEEIKWIRVLDLENLYSKQPELFLPSFTRAISVIKEYENQS
ncbi:MAG: NUDIX domain-containing protein [Patescibacteria group bacterium]